MKKEYIEREALKRDLIQKGFYPAIVKKAIETIPAADVQEVVKCEHCVYWDHGRCEGIQNGLIYDYTKPSDYCSYGKLMDGEEIT